MSRALVANVHTISTLVNNLLSKCSVRMSEKSSMKSRRVEPALSVYGRERPQVKTIHVEIIHWHCARCTDKVLGDKR